MNVISWSEVFIRIRQLLVDFGVPSDADVQQRLSTLISTIEELEERNYLPAIWRDEHPSSLGWFFPAAFAFRHQLRKAFDVAGPIDDSAACRRIAHCGRIISAVIEILRAVEPEAA